MTEQTNEYTGKLRIFKGALQQEIIIPRNVGSDPHYNYCDWVDVPVIEEKATNNITELNPPSADINYIVDGDKITGVNAENFEMLMIPHDDNFWFNGEYVKREELLAFVLISGLWVDVQDPEYCKAMEKYDD